MRTLVEKKKAQDKIWINRFLKGARERRKYHMSDQVTSYIRTFTPYIVGAIVSYLTAKGLNIPSDLQEATTALLTVALGTLYYIIVRKLEAKYPKLGWLLGQAKAPEYK